jgi:hypothetical protein
VPSSAMDSDRKAAERARLERYIADSVRLRRRLFQALIPVALAALVAAYLLGTPGTIALVILVASIGIGLYITTAHIADWRARLRDLDGPAPGTVRRRHHR